MKLQYAFLPLFIIAITSCTAPTLEDEQALFENEEIVLDNVEAQTANMENEVLEVVNSHREELGLSRLKFSSDIYMYAEEHNYYMIARGKNKS